MGLIAALLEIFVFHFRFWLDLNNEEMVIPLSAGIYHGAVRPAEDGSALMEDPAGQNIVQVDLRMFGQPEVKNLSLKVSCPDGVEVWNNYNGETYAELHSTMVEMTLILTEGENNNTVLPAEWIGAAEGRPDVIALPAGSRPEMLTLKFTALKGSTVKLTQIGINSVRRFEFSALRFGVVFGMLLFLYAFRPGSVLWQVRLLDEKGKLERKWIPAGVLGFLLLGSGILFVMLKNPVYIQGEGGFYPYRDLAHALAKGQTWIDEQPGVELLALKDPYDPVERLVNGVQYKLDYALYDGKYYVYFGVVPCLFFWLLPYMIAGIDVPGWGVLFLLLVLIYIGMACLLIRLVRRYAPGISLAGGVLLWGVGVAVLSLPAVMSDACTYYVPMLSAVTLYIYAVILYLCAADPGEDGRRSYMQLATGSFCMALVAGCRPQMVLAAIAVAPVLQPVLLKIKGKKLYVEWKSVAAFVIPYVPVAIGLMYYNAVRFGSPFDFGAAYNLTFAYTYILTFHIEAVGAGILYYLFRVPHLHLKAPYLEMTQLDWSNPGLLANHVSTGGIFMLYPVLFLTVLLIFQKRTKDNSTRTEMLRMGRIWLALTVCLAALSAVMGGMMDRYRMDFSIFGALALYCVVLGMDRMFEVKKTNMEDVERVKSRTPVWKGIQVGLVVLTVAVSTLTYLEEGVWWIRTANPEWYTELAKLIEFWH